MNALTAKFVVQIANELTIAIESPADSRDLDSAVYRARELIAGALLAIHGQILLDRSARKLFGDLLLIEGLQKQVAKQASRSMNAELIASFALSVSEFGYRLAKSLTTDERDRHMEAEALQKAKAKLAKPSIGLPGLNSASSADDDAITAKGITEAFADGMSRVVESGATEIRIEAAGKSVTFGPGDMKRVGEALDKAKTKPKAAKPKKTNGEVWKENGVHPGEQGTATEWLPKESA